MTPARLDEILGRASGRRIVVIGDLMLDEFVWGKVGRISPTGELENRLIEIVNPQKFKELSALGLDFSSDRIPISIADSINAWLPVIKAFPVLWACAINETVTGSQCRNTKNAFAPINFYDPVDTAFFCLVFILFALIVADLLYSVGCFACKKQIILGAGKN